MGNVSNLGQMMGNMSNAQLPPMGTIPQEPKTSFPIGGGSTNYSGQPPTWGGQTATNPLPTSTMPTMPMQGGTSAISSATAGGGSMPSMGGMGSPAGGAVGTK